MKPAPALLLPFAVFLLACAPVLNARLGETEDELVSRLGKVTLRGIEQVKVEKKGHKVGEQLSFAADTHRVRAVLI